MKKKLIIFLLKGVALLPLPVLYVFSDIISWVLFHVVKYRREVTFKNLSTAFPEKSEKEIKKLGKQYYRHLGDLMVETVKLFQISDKGLQKRVLVKNTEIVNQSLSEGKNAVLLLGHYGNWEWVQEITRYFIPESHKFSIYRILESPVWDEIYKDLRSRWGANIVPRNKAPRSLIDKRNMPWVCGFIADQRPDVKTPENCTFFLNHDTYFIYGPEDIGTKVGADFFYLEMVPVARGKYEITYKKLDGEKSEGKYPHIREFWKEFEDTIRRHPPYWLWSHNRWKR